MKNIQSKALSISIIVILLTLLPSIADATDCNGSIFDCIDTSCKASQNPNVCEQWDARYPGWIRSIPNGATLGKQLDYPCARKYTGTAVSGTCSSCTTDTGVTETFYSGLDCL